MKAAKGPAVAGRTTVSLNGAWEIEESGGPQEMPRAFQHTVQVPGLAYLAVPGFPDVGCFDTFQQIARKVRDGTLDPSAKTDAVGIPRQKRNYFWYQKRFTPVRQAQSAVLRIGKAQFGVEVWLNGKKVGAHLGCFTAGDFDLTDAIDWKGENLLVVRVGAHPATVPDTVPTGTDPSRRFWFPGIYDDVSLFLADNPLIESVQVAPRIETSEIVIQTRIRNLAGPLSTTVRHRIAGGAGVPANPGVEVSARVELAAGETKVVTHSLAIPNPVLWSPEHPHLYELSTSTSGDELVTRFGMRELRFDTATKRAYLNGKPYFLRGSNVALHRFLEDPKAGSLAWDEKWVRKAMAEIPKRLSWNSIRFHVGPPPDLWLRIADEAGILVFNEFPIFGWREQWGTEELAEEYKEWMRDQWNHPSIGMWDASNETRTDRLAEIIRKVRGEDLSHRAWDNGYNLPEGPDDPVEDHPYLFHGKAFDMVELERMTGAKSLNAPHPTGHAVIINEYDWLWLQRDGTPTAGTRNAWSLLLPETATPAERFALQAYLVGGLTEFWRAHRNAAGVIHFVYLSYSVPYSNSCDNFSDIEKLTLQPLFEDYIKEAFKPLGVYLNFWQPVLAAGSVKRLSVMMVNDSYQPAAGRLVVSLTSEGGTELAKREVPFLVAAIGQQTYAVDLGIPEATGRCILKAAAYADGASEPTVSRRKVAIEKQPPAG